MIDFMANIKNKKNMTKCNIKTLMATSVLCVFFNGVLIYGMYNEAENSESDFIFSGDNISINKNNHIKNDNDSNIDNMESLMKQQVKKNENLYKNDEIFNKRNRKKITYFDKKEDSSIFFNYKGNFSLLFCCNFCNNKKENRKKYLKEKRDKEECDDEIDVILKYNNNMDIGLNDNNNIENNTKGNIVINSPTP